MPGMMDTILNLGLNMETVKGLASKNNPRFAWDCLRRFIQMFGDVVLNIKHSKFEQILEKHKKENGVENDSKLSDTALQSVVNDYLALI